MVIREIRSEEIPVLEEFLYQKAGSETVADRGDELLMVCDLFSKFV